MSATPFAQKHGFLGRLLRATPIIGRMIREIEQDISTIFWLLPVFILALVLAVLAHGPAAVVLVALASVPCLFAFFVILCWP